MRDHVQNNLYIYECQGHERQEQNGTKVTGQLNATNDPRLALGPFRFFFFSCKGHYWVKADKCCR